MCGSLHMIHPLENQDLSLLDICPVGATFLFAFFALEVSETTIPFGLLRLAEQLVPCSATTNALARLRFFANTVPTAPFKFLPLLLSPSIDRRRSISTVPPGSGQFAYRSASGLVRTARYGVLPLGKAIFDILELQKVAFVPVANGTRLVTVNSLFVRLMVNLSPFAFELPSLYLPFVKILKEIGMQEVLSVSYARELLLNIQKSCGYQRLNPNELRAVITVLNFMCSEVHSTPSEVDWLSDAIIPDDGCRLVLARSCVYVDYYGSQFLSNVDTSRLRFAHPELSETTTQPRNCTKQFLDDHRHLDTYHRAPLTAWKAAVNKPGVSFKPKGSLLPLPSPDSHSILGAAERSNSPNPTSSEPDPAVEPD
ncbi:hypothetical protein BHM03_00028743 [Ensete ventricosum]|nr:hypothetical protein BHM03_00028743 [Ensete ventricosum]